MPLNITLNGDINIINSGMDAFAKQNGWQPELPNPEYHSEDPESPKTIANPVSALDFSLTKLGKYFRENVIAWNIKLAEQAAANQAQLQINAALDMTNMTAQLVEE